MVLKDGDPYNGAYDPDKYLAREKDKLRSIEAYIDDPDIIYPEDAHTTPEDHEALKRQQNKVNELQNLMLQIKIVIPVNPKN